MVTAPSVTRASVQWAWQRSSPDEIAGGYELKSHASNRFTPLEREENIGMLRFRLLRWYAMTAACAALTPSTAGADATSVINSLRSAQCGDLPPAEGPVERDDRLDLVARELARAYSLEQAIARADYPAESASSLHLRGPRNDDEIRSALVDGFCRSVGSPLRDRIGVFEDGIDTWIVLASRKPDRPPLEPAMVVRRVLALVNEARAAARTCGDDRFDATGPLHLSDVLNAAAEGHSWDMAARGYAGHDGSDGSNSGQRITRVGYTWRAAGENVAAGQPDADAVVQAWLDSPGHCSTLMAPWFTETGIGFAEAPSKNPPIYWTQVFAAPREPATVPAGTIRDDSD